MNSENYRLHEKKITEFLKNASVLLSSMQDGNKGKAYDLLEEIIGLMSLESISVYPPSLEDYPDSPSLEEHLENYDSCLSDRLTTFKKIIQLIDDLISLLEDESANDSSLRFAIDLSNLYDLKREAKRIYEEAEEALKEE
jgi:hypothetical protein